MSELVRIHTASTSFTKLSLPYSFTYSFNGSSPENVSQYPNLVFNKDLSW